MNVLLSLIAASLVVISEAAWGMKDEKKVILKDVSVLTLHFGKMTNGRRSSPVPQLECIDEGTAPCSAFRPKVVQCINKGSDGYDIQWECKTDMDNAFRFGEVEVSCEGYDYPEDPYILYGSCGLRYSLDYTKEGLNQNKQHNYYGNNDYKSSFNAYVKPKASSHSYIADIIVYIGMGLMAYAFYKTCINPGRMENQDAYSSTNSDYPGGGGGGFGGGGGGGYGWFGGTNEPPPPGYNDASCGARRRQGYGAPGMGGFWTGAATGGLLGYMFGNRQGGWGGWGGGNRGYGGFNSSGSGFHSSAGGSSGTRTASGFGGTSRR